MKWHFLPAGEAFASYKERWDAINAGHGGHVLLDSLFVEGLLRHFGSDGVLLAILGDPAHAMAFVAMKSRGVWETYQPSQAPLGLALCQPGAEAEGAISSLLRALPGYALQFSVLHQDPDYLGFGFRENAAKVQRLDYIRTARIVLDGSFDAYWQSREGRLRKNNDRLRRRMAEKGLTPEFVTIREAAGIGQAIREYGRLESKGWKAQEGTAVSEANSQGHFYRGLLEGFCARGEGAIYQLRVNGQVIASDICICRKDMLVLLKTAYDEEWSVYSPGFLLREDVMRQLYSEGNVRCYEFYGPLMDYQLLWTSDVRTLFHLTCYRYGWLQPVKNVAERLRGRI